MTSTQYESGRPYAGDYKAEELNAAADTYYVGMPVSASFATTATADGGNTGDGTVTDLSANSDSVPGGGYTLEFISALVAELKDPAGNVVGVVNLPDGGDITVTIGGITFTVTDGAAAFVAGDTFDIAVATSPVFAYDADRVEAVAMEDLTLASAGNLVCAVHGSEIIRNQLKDDSNSSLTVSEAVVLEARNKFGIILR
jgi:hypothetical protein